MYLLFVKDAYIIIQSTLLVLPMCDFPVEETDCLFVVNILKDWVSDGWLVVMFVDCLLVVVGLRVNNDE